MKIRNAGKLRAVSQPDAGLTGPVPSCPAPHPSPGIPGIRAISWQSLAPLRVGTSSLFKSEKLSRPKGNKPPMGTRRLLFWDMGFCQAAPKSPLFLPWIWDYWKYICKCLCEIQLFRTEENVFFKRKHLCQNICLIRLIGFFKIVPFKRGRIKNPL